MAFKSKRKQSFLGRNAFGISMAFVLLVLAIPLTIVTLNKSTNNKAAAATNDRYGIASGDVIPYLSPAELNTYMDEYKNLGAGWIRFDLEWIAIQDGGPTSYNWDRYDAVVNAAHARGIKVLFNLAYTPTWARPAGCVDGYLCAPKNPTDYANFARVAVAHYAPMGVHHWEIWNEPNGGTFTPTTYTALMKVAYPAIKEADPTAFVLAGGSMPADTGNGDYSPIDFLTGIYANGGKNYFDALAHHPYCWGSGLANCPVTFADWSAWSQMQDTNPSLRSIMTANGDQNKQIWATEFGAPTGGSDPGAISETRQAQLVTDSINLWNSYSWSGPMIWYTYRDKCTASTDPECYFGLARLDGTHKPAFDVFKNIATSGQNPTPTSTQPTPTSAQQGTTSVTSLTAQPGTPNATTTVNFTLQTTGSLTIPNLIIAARNQNNADFDFPEQTNVTLSGTQSFTFQQALPAGTYTYWVAYYKNGVWNDLPPTNTFTVASANPTPTKTPTPTPTRIPTATPTPASSDKTPPTVSITSPTNNAYVSRNRTTTITASASDNVGVKRVEFYVNNSLKCTDTTSPYTCAWAVPSGYYKTYYLTAKAFDAAGNNKTSTQITVRSR